MVLKTINLIFFIMGKGLIFSQLINNFKGRNFNLYVISVNGLAVFFWLIQVDNILFLGLIEIN